MKKSFYLFFKRVFDISCSFIAIVLLLFPMLVIGIIIKCDSKGPIFYKQERIGKHGKIFKMLKFRSMVVGAEAQGVYSNDKDNRVTKFGKILRKTSLDELPQLINVLKGEMSFIGPRPPLTYHPWTFDKYSKEQLKMFDLRPGLTGWAQINGRKEVEWHKRIDLNIWYVEHISFGLDFRIFFLTIFKIIKNEGNENTRKTVE